MEEQRRCGCCGTLTETYTYALLPDEDDDKRDKPVVVCLKCKQSLPPKKRRRNGF